MNFYSATFGVFFLATLTLYWLLAERRQARTLVLVVASYVFYGCWELWYLALIAFSTLLDYTCGGIIARSEDPSVRRRALFVSLAGNLGVLAFFKYTQWGIESLAQLFGRLGLDVPLPALEIAVPVGISFYTFQTLSYTLDVYRRQVAPARNLLDFAFFVAFFPQLVAGPIVRASKFLPQLDREPPMERARFVDGVWRVVTGLIKKVVLADTLGRLLVDPVYAVPEEFSPLAHAVALYAFTFQIYYDFSGYSDIAIGLARLLGYDLPENFNGPFRARSVTEFWRRWHISLGSWVRDYLFYPLMGRGRLRSEARFARNMLITMVVIGIWHGAGLLWILYGTVQGLVMVAERWAFLRRGKRSFVGGPVSAAVAWLLTFHFVVLVSGLCVRPEDTAHMLRVAGRYGDQAGFGAWGLAALGAGALLHFLPLAWIRGTRDLFDRLPLPVSGMAAGAALGGVAILVVGETPFIYFQF